MSSPLVGNEANLVAYWAMNEDAGTSVGDSSPNSNTGTFVNYPQWFIGVADSDSDGINNGCDLLEGCNDMADLYSDLVINLPDLALLAENWLCISNCTADVDGDGDTDLDDLLVMAANWLCAGKE